MADKMRCMRCMKEYDGQYDVCPHCGYKRNAVPKNPMHLPEGTILNDKYILGEVIGQGGFGITYVAFDISLERKVAIKEYFPYGLSTRTTASPTVMPVTTHQNENNYEYGKRKFIEEARTLARFSHMESIVSVSSYFEQNNTVYIVMEYLDGEDLLKHVKDRGGKIGLDETLALIAPVFDALEAIHAAGMIHRDISPDNIFITHDGKTKLLDFGTARFAMGERSKSLSVILTPGYAPPEQYTSRGKQGPWTDVYSLAATIYRAITGESAAEAVDRQMGEEVKLPFDFDIDISEAEEDMLMWALELEPKERPQTISEFREELYRANEKTLDSQKRNKEKRVNNYLSDDSAAVTDRKDWYDDYADSAPREMPDKGSYGADRKKWYVGFAIVLSAVLLTTIIIAIVNDAVQNREPTIDSAVADTSSDETGSAEEATTKNLLFKRNGTTVSAGLSHTVGLESDGGVVAVGDNFLGKCNVGNWEDIVAVSAGDEHTVGLKSDGSVVAAGLNDMGACDVGDWKDIVAISAGGNNTIGLKSDGSVVAAGYNDFGECNVEDWEDIVAVSVGYSYDGWGEEYSHTVGVKTDGSVVAVGYNDDGQCEVDDWENIVAVSANRYHTVGLKTDGSVVAVGNNDYGQCNVEDWEDIVAVSAGEYNTVGLKTDGSVVAVGLDYWGECDVEDWEDIVAVSAGHYYTVGLKSDGSVVAVGSNNDGQCDVDGWTDIMLPPVYNAVLKENESNQLVDIPDAGLEDEISIGGQTIKKNTISVELFGCGISDISALNGFTNLQYLGLACNNISDISALNG